MFEWYFFFSQDLLLKLCFNLYLYTTTQLFYYFLIVIFSFVINLLALFYFYRLLNDLFYPFKKISFSFLKEKFFNIPKLDLFIFFTFFFKQIFYWFFDINFVTYTFFYFTAIFLMFCLFVIFFFIRKFILIFYRKQILDYEQTIGLKDPLDFLHFLFWVFSLYFFVSFDEKVYTSLGFLFINQEPDEKILLEFLEKYVPDYEDLLSEIENEKIAENKKDIK